jgi:hypothetical protein
MLKFSSNCELNKNVSLFMFISFKSRVKINFSRITNIKSKIKLGECAKFGGKMYSVGSNGNTQL